MSRTILVTLIICLVLAACASSSKNTTEKNGMHNNASVAGETSDRLDSLPTDLKPSSMLDLPQSQDGEVILSEGLYEADFRSYCLQPGTPDPSNRDAYTQMPLNAPRRDIVETILRNSLDRPDLEQKNIQLLLWSVVSGSDYNRLAPQVKSTSRQLLTSKQIFALQGGVMGVVKTIAASMPETPGNSAFNAMKDLFELGSSSYEAYEQIAVLRQPSVIKNPGYKKEQWYRQDGGYYVRYFPDSYQRVKVQVYVPSGTLDQDGKKNGEYLTFDPVTTMAVPANSNAQRLGVGAPVAVVVRKVIEIQKKMPRKAPSNPSPAPRTDPKGIVLD